MEKKNFEDALFKLEEIASKLESGEMGLEESITNYEKGMELAKYCREKLDEAERKIEILQKTKKGEKPVKKEITIKDDTGELDENEEIQGSLL
ncbi:MAG: exodeoxyribonuclease VII small subunit [Spirochaetes bacterium]|nr:exodeoxyribonuclease VII small subunit [Spirochaetota bacterium]